MCITNIYTDQYPDGRLLEFRSTDRCQDRILGRPCTQSIVENPVRKIQFGEATMEEYMLTTRNPPTGRLAPLRASSSISPTEELDSDGGSAQAVIDPLGKQIASLNRSTRQLRPVDVEEQCGVIKDGLPCAQNLTCKSHTIGAKRAVAGRSLPFDLLLAREMNRPRQQIEELEPWREVGLPPDELIRQQDDEISGRLVVPTVSNKGYWAGFDGEMSRSNNESKSHDSSDEDDIPWLVDEPEKDFTPSRASLLAERTAAMSSFNHRIDEMQAARFRGKTRTLASTPAKLDTPLALDALYSNDSAMGTSSTPLSPGQKPDQHNPEERIGMSRGEETQIGEYSRPEEIPLHKKLLRDKDSAVKPRQRRASRPKVKTGCNNCKNRRVKCDETRPQCNKCVRSGRQCDGYPAYKRRDTIPNRELLSHAPSSWEKPRYPHQQQQSLVWPKPRLLGQPQGQSQAQVLQLLDELSRGRDFPDVPADSTSIIEGVVRFWKKEAKLVVPILSNRESWPGLKTKGDQSSSLSSLGFLGTQPGYGDMRHNILMDLKTLINTDRGRGISGSKAENEEADGLVEKSAEVDIQFSPKPLQGEERAAMASFRMRLEEALKKEAFKQLSTLALMPGKLDFEDEDAEHGSFEGMRNQNVDHLRLPNPAQSMEAGSKKTLKKTSCTECRRRKQKCNGARPCNNCGRRYPPVFCTDPIAQKPSPEFASQSQNESSSYLQHTQPRRQRTREEVSQIKAARQVEIERRCTLLDPPIPASLLAQMPAFQAAIQIIQPLDDGAWEILKPRLLSHWETAEWREYERVAQTQETGENFNKWRLQDAKGPNESAIDTSTKKRYPSRSSSVESLQSLVDSIFSLGSLSSASTAPGTNNAFQRVLAILKSDAVLKELYEELTAKTSVDKFNRNFGTLLKRFALDLEKEAKCWNEQRAAQFIRSRARIMAQKIADWVYPSERESQKARHGTVKQDKGEISEDSDLEEEPDEFMGLEIFITNSIAFQKLRDNIRLFLGLEPSSKINTFNFGSSILFTDFPFAEGNQFDTSDETIYHEQDVARYHQRPWDLSNFRQKIRDLFLPEPPILEGLSRVKWKCPCGETLYDDYQELKPGAAKRMEDYLRRFSYKICAGDTKSITERISTLGSSFKGLAASVIQRIQTMKSGEQPALINTEPRYYSGERTTRNPAHTSGEIFYLLLCHNSGVGAEIVKLRQPDICDINNDKKLFSFLHEEYTTLRKRWWAWISLWTLQSIKFVRFELYENELVDVKKLDEVPPPTKDNEYRHGPPNPPELNPPLGSTLLMHLFKHPELAGTRKHCLKKIPRKLRSRLAVIDEEDDAIGWGLQFVEGWSKKRLMYMTALMFGLGSLVVMVLVSVLGQNIQNAAAIASFMLSFVTIGIATAQAALHMS